MEGKIIQVLGTVVDVEFESYLPAIFEALDINFEVNGVQKSLVLEVAAIWAVIGCERLLWI